MEATFYDDIYSRLDALVEREKSLRASIAEVQKERDRLKSDLNIFDVSRPSWLSELPQEFWYPSYLTSKVINDARPNLEYKNTPPDLIDWAKGSGVTEFILNLAIGIGVAIVGLQLFFFLL
jgi:hypothetical protein